MKTTRNYSLLIFFLLLYFGGQAQEIENKLEPLQILSVNINQSENVVEATVLAPKINNAVFNSTTAKFSEQIDGKMYPMKFFRFEEVGTNNQDIYSILFVLDWSGSMREEDRLVKAKEAIFNTIQSITLPPGSKFYLTAFHDDIFENVEVNKSNIEANLAQYFVPPVGKGKGTDLYRATIVKTQQMKNFKGKKIILLLSDGENDLSLNQHYRISGEVPPTPDDVFNAIRQEDSTESIAFYPIGLGKGADTTFLKQIPELTKNPKDRYIYSESPDDLINIFLTILSQYSVTYQVKLIPDPRVEVFKGESREMRLDWQAKGLPSAMVDFYPYQGGSFIEPVNLGISQSTYNTTFWLMYMLIGAGIVGGLLALLMYLVPFLKKREFKTKYVVPYVPEKNKVRRDPITQDAFDEGDDVVVKCKQMTSLATWEALGHCPNYPNCMEFGDPCNGSGGEDIQSHFFSQQGIFRVLNWLWFGATGGFAAWILYAIFQIINVNWLYEATSSYFNGEGMKDRLMELRGGESFLKNIQEMVDQTMIGLFIGACLIIAIAVVEERGHSRQFSFWRIFIRGTVGVFVSFAIFFSGYIFQYLVLPQPFLAGIVIWAVFGIAFGAILSLNSTVELKKGIIGGVVSSLASYLIYYGISAITPDDVLAKLLSFIALGGVLGALIVTVLSNLEDFELIYLSPQEYTGMKKPISKWLKKGMEIYIGRSSKCYVFIKWEDEYVDDRHAKLIYQGGSVHIIPLFETMVNGVIVPENQKTALEGDDIIQLGRYSISRMQYKEKRS